MVKKFSKDIQKAFENIDKLNPQEIYNLTKEILKTSDLSKKMASGNKDFLKKGLNYFEKYGLEKFEGTKYPQGMKNHLRRALPAQEGFIASKVSDLSLESNVQGYQRIINELNNVRGLSLNGLIGLNEEILNEPILSSVPGQKSNLKILEQFTETYKKKVKENNIEVAEKYLRGASNTGKIRLNTLLNILSKSYLPNLTTHLSKK